MSRAIRIDPEVKERLDWERYPDEKNYNDAIMRVLTMSWLSRIEARMVEDDRRADSLLSVAVEPARPDAADTADAEGVGP